MRRLWASVLLLALAVAARAEEPKERGGGGGPPMPPAQVEVAPVVVRPVSAGRTFVGSVEPARRSLVGTEFGGLVVEVLAREGDRVEADQALARLRTEILDLRLEAQRAELESRRQHLAELENGSRPEEIEQARARVEQLRADLELRQWKHEASKRLYEQETISEDELRDARLAVRASELLLDAAEAALDLVEAGPREEQVAQARAGLERQDAEVRRLEEERRRHEIRAPFAGYVVEEHAEVGQWIATGAPVAEVVALDEVDVTIQVVEDFVGKLTPGMPVRVGIDALPNRVFTGTIHKIVPRADERGRTFPVKIRLANERVGASVLIKAGMFASAALAVGEERPATLVPKDAIVLGGPVPVLVWLVGEGNKAQIAPVQLGVAVDDLIEVIGPVPPQTRVVVKGNERVFMPGRQLEILN